MVFHGNIKSRMRDDQPRWLAERRADSSDTIHGSPERHGLVHGG